MFSHTLFEPLKMQLGDQTDRQTDRLNMYIICTPTLTLPGNGVRLKANQYNLLEECVPEYIIRPK